MWRKKKTPALLVGLQTGTTTMEISLAVPQKIGHSTTEDPSITVLGLYPEDAPTCNKDTAEFEQILRELRLQVNSTRLDLSLTKGLPNWISSAFPFFKEWVGLILFGDTLCCGLVLLLWLVCKLKA